MKLTADIRAKAEELNRDPIRIYEWVRNNIEWLPTWGATQDSQLTLEMRKGNAMDIAALTLALLRASGIPSRYVHGKRSFADAYSPRQQPRIVLPPSPLGADRMNNPHKSRKQRTPEQWQQLVAEQQARGQSQAEFCRAQGLSLSTFQFWKQRLTRAVEKVPDAPSEWIEIPAQLASAEHAWDIELELGGGVRLRLRRR